MRITMTVVGGLTLGLMALIGLGVQHVPAAGAATTNPGTTALRPRAVMASSQIDRDGPAFADLAWKCGRLLATVSLTTGDRSGTASVVATHRVIDAQGNVTLEQRVPFVRRPTALELWEAQVPTGGVRNELAIVATDSLGNRSTKLVRDVCPITTPSYQATPVSVASIGTLGSDDRTGPTLGLPSGACAQQAIAVALEVTDASGVASVTAFNADLQHRSSMALRSGSTVTWSGLVPARLGANRIEITAKDRYGNSRSTVFSGWC